MNVIYVAIIGNIMKIKIKQQCANKQVVLVFLNKEIFQ